MSGFEQSTVTIISLVGIIVRTLNEMIIANNVSFLDWLVGIMISLIIAGVLIAPMLKEDNRGGKKK